MKCYVLTLGARNTPKAGRRFSRDDDLGVRRITRRHFPDGFTILTGRGGWWDASRESFVEEETRQVLVCTPTRATLRKWCLELGNFLQQKELLAVELGASLVFK